MSDLISTGPDYRAFKGEFSIEQVRPEYQDMFCSCGVFRANYQYGVRDEVWAEARFSPGDIFCVECLEKALGRPLVIEDFTVDPINHTILFGYLMGVRAARSERDDARANARILAHSYQNDCRPPRRAVDAALAYPAVPAVP